MLKHRKGKQFGGGVTDVLEQKIVREHGSLTGSKPRDINFLTISVISATVILGGKSMQKYNCEIRNAAASSLTLYLFIQKAPMSQLLDAR